MSFRAALGAALWSMLLLALPGCSSLPFFGGQDQKNAARPPKPLPPEQFRLRVDAPGNLSELLSKNLDLARLQRASEADSLTSGELDRLMSAAAVQARSILETEGYFNAEVKVTRENSPGDKLPLLLVKVQPGPPARVSSLKLEVQGPLEVQAEAGDEDAVQLREAIHDDWPLRVGQPFISSDWESAKRRVLAALRGQGYLAANWSGTVAHVDAETQSVRLYLVADSGPRFFIGKTEVSGLQRYDSGTVIPVVRPWTGKPASEQVLNEIQERLLAIGLFEGVVVSVEANADHAAAAPLLVSVRELTLQAATVGVGISDSVGLQGTLEYTHRDIFDSRWVAAAKFQIGTKQNLAQIDLTSHPLENGYRHVLAAQVERLDSADEIRESWYARAGQTIDGIRIGRLYYLEYAGADLQTSAGDNNSSALSANYHWLWRDLDSQRVPTQGMALSLQGAAGYAEGTVTGLQPGQEAQDSGPFARAYGRWSGFWPLADTWFGSARLELGEVFVNEALTVPDTLLFRAGGEDSVRGYAYRTLGPQVNGATVSGSKLFTASVQLEHPIVASQPDFLGAVFIDAGNAANTWNDLSPVFGYGVGVHWRSPVGPLRVDLAYGQEVRRFRLSFSVGVSF